MATNESRLEVPTWVAGLLAVLIPGSFVYGIVVRQSIIEPIAWWASALQLALGVVVVYLLYRFVLAVERIADKL